MCAASGAPSGAEGHIPGYVRVASVAEVPPGTVKAVRAGPLAVALCNVEGEILAVEDNCSHMHFPLSRGELDDATITCDWHGAVFDLRTGEPLSLPAVEPIRTFQVRVEEGEIYVRIEGEAPTPPEALIQQELEGGRSGSGEAS